MTDDSAFVRFVDEAWRRHLRFALLLTGNQTNAEELLQDSLVKVYERWRRLARRDDPHAYLRRVITNNHVSMWRRRRQEDLVAAVPDRAGREVRPDPHTDDLRRVLLALPPRQRAVIVLRHYEDLPEREIARLLGCSIGTVKSQYARGMVKLRGLILEPSFDRNG
jgi:RNA polymerase sigma-70 factor (sigma-E family)